MKISAILVLGIIFLVPLVSAGACPAGPGDCFLCGGVDGIPCARSDSCAGGTLPGSDTRVACACPQGKPCECYCPYADYGSKPIGPQPPAGKCPAGCVDCTSDKAICISHEIEDIAPPQDGDAAIITASEGEVLVSNDGGKTWARATGGAAIGDGYIVKTVGKGNAVVLFRNGWTSELAGDTQITAHLEKQGDRETTIIEDLSGLIFGYTEKEFNPRTGGYIVETPMGTVTATRTQFSVSYDPPTKQGTVKLYRGEVNVSTSHGSILLEPNQTVTMTQGGLGQVTEFDPSQDETPFSAGCCGPALVLALVLCGTLFLRRG